MNAGLVLVALAATCGINLQATLDQIRVAQEVPGVSAVVTREEEVIFAGASGVADLETGRKMTPDTVLYAGSLTKILTAVLTLQLVEKGELSLDDVIPGIAIAIESSKQDVNIQVAHLLTHVSGLEREGNFDYWFHADFPDEAALANNLATTDLQSAPGDSVSYSNIGYAALGPVIARASGQSYDDALLDDVFKPLGMDSSGTEAPGNQLSAGYSPVNRVIPNEERPFAGLGRYVGWFAAHRTHLLLDLGSGIAVVVMANSGSASPEDIAEALLDHALCDASGGTGD